MINQGPTYKLLVLLLLLVGLTIACYSLYLKHDFILLGIVGAFDILVLASIIRYNSQNARKLVFMFNSIENGDYSFKFTESTQRRDSNQQVNQALNRIKALLTKARDETIDQEKYYQIILESVNTGIVIINERGHVMQTNHETTRLLGLENFTHISQLTAIDERFPDLMRTIQPGESRQLTYNTERGVLTLSVHASEIFKRGEALKILTLTDIENELSDREIESWIRLIRVLTHEIMNSVNPITSISDSLVQRIDSGDDTNVKKGLEAISQTAKSLISFVESYRKFTRLPAPKQSLFYLKEFMENMRSIALATVPPDSKPVEIELSIVPDDLILYADQNQISQVVINLLKNAIEASLQSERPRITFCAIVDNRERIIMTVEDNGPGIPADVADHIFVPFFTTKTGGSGVGLSLSRQIMRLHGGTLKYHPGPHGHGSVFTMTFN